MSASAKRTSIEHGCVEQARGAIERGPAARARVMRDFGVLPAWIRKASRTTMVAWQSGQYWSLHISFRWSQGPVHSGSADSNPAFRQ